MVVEYIRYAVDAERSAAFEAAYGTAGLILDDDPHCRRWEVTRGVEEPTHFIVRIEWDSLEGHLKGFRGGPTFEDFFAAVRPFFGDIEEMKHYEPVDLRAEA